MARRSTRFRILAFLLIIIPLFMLVMVFGVEWSYVEKISREETNGQDRTPDNNRKRTAMSPNKYNRSPLDTDEQLRVVDVPVRPSSVDDGRVGRAESNRLVQKQAQPNMNTSVLRSLSQHSPLSDTDKAKLYQLLRERKVRELRTEKSMRELWWYIRDRVGRLERGEKIAEETLASAREQYFVMRWQLNELKGVSVSDSPTQLNWYYWQRSLSQEMTELMEKRLDYLQNPPDCTQAKKLVCEVAKTCGFGCQIHHVAYCFIMAYATKRTLILDSRNWRYSVNGWDVVFQPISSTCTTASGHSHFSLDSKADTVFLPPVDGLAPRPPQLPMAIPNDLSDRLMAFHGFPFAWFVAQFLKLLMRPSPKLKQFLTQNRQEIGLNTTTIPIVGIHVRRTDKRTEAKYHDIEEYMEHVEDWYQLYELTHLEQVPVRRRIYIATDEPKVLTQAKEKYPNYIIYSDNSISSLASKTSTRYSLNSLFGVLFDITVLSECNYVVCTFSSQVCRVAYELMQTHSIDASNSYYSLDDVYYYGGQQSHDVIAIMDNKEPMTFEIGDHMGIAGNEKNGFSVGQNRRTRRKGTYPSYKVEEYVRTADFPTYSELD